MLDEFRRAVVPAPYSYRGLPDGVLPADAVERPGGGVIGVFAGGRGGGQADDVDGAVARGEPQARVNVVVAVQHELRTFFLEHALECAGVFEGAAPRRQAGNGRVVDEQHAIVAALPEVAKNLAEVSDLQRSEPSAGT